MKKNFLFIILTIFFYACGGGHNQKYHKEIEALKDSIVNATYLEYNLSGDFNSAISLTQRLDSIQKIRNAIISDSVIEFNSDLFLSVNDREPVKIKCRILSYNNKVESITLDFDVLASIDNVFKIYNLKYGNGYTKEKIKMTPTYWSANFYELKKNLTLYKWSFQNSRVELHDISKKIKSTTRVYDESRENLNLRNPMNYFKEETTENTIETVTVKYINIEQENRHNNGLKNKKILEKELQEIKAKKERVLLIEKNIRDSIMKEKKGVEIKNQQL